MRMSVVLSGVVAFAALTSAGAPAMAATHSAQSAVCASEADQGRLKGSARSAFVSRCMKGALAPRRPTAPTAPNHEARAIVAPSGADRTVRSRQCDAEADRRGLQTRARAQFRLSCLATAGPVSESQTINQPPKPAKAIPGLGDNDNKPR
jgi:hypothetical protein